MQGKKNHIRRAFTLVELLVVLGIIAVLISIIMPALNKARAQSNRIACLSNMRQVGIYLIMYASDNKGYMYPVGAKGSDGYESGLGTNITDPKGRWPVYVFKPAVPNPPVMICPRDTELGLSDTTALDKHSYILNKHLIYQDIRYHRNRGVPKHTIVVMGEKKSEFYDYYMEVNDYGKPSAKSDYDAKVELYRHGLQFGANQLYLDGHADNERPEPKLGALDPWQVVVETPATPTTPPTP